MNFPACTYKSENFAHSQLNFAPSHDGETVTFRNSVMIDIYSVAKDVLLLFKLNI